MSQKCTPMWREAHFEVKRVMVSDHFLRLGAVDVSRGSAKMQVRMAGAIQETSPSNMLGGQGADFLTGVAFWSIRSVGVLR